jgi:uncharacterized protein (DUF169 family)
MESGFKKRFLESWERYFGQAELPITFYYTDEENRGEMVDPPSAHQCIIGVLSKARRGRPICFEAESVGCGGGKRYLGYAEQIRPHFEYFLSCGIPGEIEGERYKKSPELVREIMKNLPSFKAPGRFIVFKRWDQLERQDEPEVVIFFAKPDVLSGLFVLANYREPDPNGVITPFSSGCGSIVLYPFLERQSAKPRAVLGMFDVSARPFVGSGELTLAMPTARFRQMVEDMGESFLITPSWEKVRRRIDQKK